MNTIQVHFHWGSEDEKGSEHLVGNDRKLTEDDFLSFDDFAILQKLHEDAEMAFFAHQCLL